MKKLAKIMALTLAAVLMISVFAACGGNGGAKDALAGTWSQKDDTNGNWTWIFDGNGKCTLKGDYYSGEGTYTLDEANKKVTVKEVWSEEKEFDYVLTDTTLDLTNKYQTFKTTKEQ